MSLVEEILACPTLEQVLIYLSELSEQELGEALDEVELVNTGNRRSKIKRLRNYVFRVKGFSSECFSGTSSNATRDNSIDLSEIRGLSTRDLNGSLNEIPISVTVPVTVTASEVIPSFPITTMAGTLSRDTLQTGARCHDVKNNASCSHGAIGLSVGIRVHKHLLYRAT